jgi:sugar lactone lactonase YvrE
MRGASFLRIARAQLRGLRREARPKRAIALAALLLVVALVIASSAFGDNAEREEPGSGPAVLTPQLIQEAISSPTADMSATTTDDQAARTLPHDELERGEALNLLTSVFATEVESPAGIFDNLEVEKFITDHAAVMSAGVLNAGASSGEGELSPAQGAEPILVESSVPLRAEDSEGNVSPVDLSLEHRDGELKPANPLVDAGIPLELGEGISLANESIGLEFLGDAGERDPSVIEGDSAFYPNVQDDSDLIVSPTAEGVETFTQLRTAEAPRTQRVHVDLPPEAALKQTEAGGAEATLDGRVVLEVPPPTALDAAGNVVPTSLEVSGDTVEIMVSPTFSNAYPILVDPLWRGEGWNWTWENSSLGAWEPVSSAPSYKSLSYAYGAGGGFKAMDMTSGFSSGPAPQYTAANWFLHVPRWNSDWAEGQGRPKSFIYYLGLGAMMFLTEGNPAYSPVEVAGILDESSGTWVTVGQHSGYDGDIVGWSGHLQFENINSQGYANTNAQEAVVALTATENEAQSRYRNAIVGTAWAGFSDRNAPHFTKLTEPTEWMNTAETSHIGYQVEDQGLGVFELLMYRPGQSGRAEWGLGCTGLPLSPCKRTYSSEQAGAVNLAVNPATAPQGIDHYTVGAVDPLGSLKAPGQGETPGVETEPTGHADWEEVLVKIDHTAPTLSLSGSITEQASLGSTLPEYKLKYAAADGGEEAPAAQAPFGAAGSGAGQLSHPADLAVDSNGNIWVADENNNRIEKFGYKGEYLAAYGSLGSGNGQFNHPTGIAVDSAGNVYVADTGNNRIEKLSESGAFQSAFGSSGTGNGQFASPQGIAVDSAGRIWVADTGNNRVEELNAKGAFLASFGSKGSAAGQISEPAALATAPNGNIWVADTGNNRVEVFNEQGDFLASYGSLGSGNGQFNRPAGIDVDKLGNVWVADLNNNRVEQLSERGEYLGKFGSKGAATGQLSFTGPIGLATNRNGRLWVADSGNNRIGNWNAPQGTQSGVRNVAIKVDGKLVEQPKQSCETGGCPLAGEWALHSGEYTAGSHTVEVVATDGVQLATPKTLTITLNPPAPSLSLTGTMTEQGTLGNTLPRYKMRLSATSQEGTGAPPITAPIYASSFGSAGSGNGQFAHPGDVAVDAAGNLWVVDENNNRVEKFSAAGEYLAKFGSSGAANGQLSHPTALAIDSKGNLWVTDSGNKRIEEFNESGEYVAKFGSAGSGNGQFGTAGPEGIAIDSKGNIWVSDTTASRVEEFNAKGEFLKVVGSKGGEPGQLSEPTGIDISPANNVFVADWANDRVEVYNEAGEYLRQFGIKGTGPGQFEQADGIAIDPSGMVWVGDQNNRRIEEFNQNGHFVTQFGASGSGAGQLNLGYPIGIAADAKGNLWVTDSGNNRVQRWVEPSRSLVKTEVTVNGEKVDSGEVACSTETCTTAREWTLESSAHEPGSYTVTVKATDGFGKTTTKTIPVVVQRDTTGPAISTGGELANAPSGWVQQESYGFNVTASDSGGYGATTLVFKIDGATVASTEGGCPEGGCQESLSKSVEAAKYSGGAHNAEVIATDGAGNSSTKRWTVNVDPEGHVSTAEATATLEAAEATSAVNVVGESREEEGIEGTGDGLGIEEEKSGALVGTGTIAPINFDTTPGGGFTVVVPAPSDLEPCSSGEDSSPGDEAPENLGEPCPGELSEEATEPVPITVTPAQTKEGASSAYLVDENAVLTSNSTTGGDTTFRPLINGGMTWNTIRDDTAPETYSWQVELGNNQELHLLDEHHAVVYYNNLTPALSITAEPGHDAVGTEVPTSLSVSNGDIVTLTVRYKAGHNGQPFVYPINEGAGWEGGLQTAFVDFYNKPPEEEEEEEVGGQAGDPSIALFVLGPAIKDDSGSADQLASPSSVESNHRYFKFTYCWPHHIPGDLGPPGAFDPGFGGDLRVSNQNIAPQVSECHREDFHGIYWGTTVHGTYHYKIHHWVRVDSSQLGCDHWGEEQPRTDHCYVSTQSRDPGPVNVWGEYRFHAGKGSFVWAEGGKATCFLWGGRLYPRIPSADGGPYERPAIYRPKGIIPGLGECPWPEVEASAEVWP